MDGCVTARAAWASGPSALASRGHGAVDVVGPVAPPGHACSCGSAGVYTDRRKWPLRAVLGHLCTLLGRGLGLWVALGSQQCTQMGGSGFSAPFWGVCVHCCDASRDTSSVRWHERLNHHGVPAAPPHWSLPLSREDRLCASGAAARLASSPRRQPTRTPEELRRLFGVSGG